MRPRQHLVWTLAFVVGAVVVAAILGDWLTGVFVVAGAVVAQLLIAAVGALGRAGDRHRAWDDPHRPAE